MAAAIPIPCPVLVVFQTCVSRRRFSVFARRLLNRPYRGFRSNVPRGTNPIRNYFSVPRGTSELLPFLLLPYLTPAAPQPSLVQTHISRAPRPRAPSIL